MKKTDPKKKILLVSSRFYPPRDGGELAVFEQLQYLISRGYSCASLHFRGWDGKPFLERKVFRCKGLKIIQSPHENSESIIRRTIEDVSPSVVYTYSFPAPKALFIARNMGIKTILGTYSLREIQDIYTGKSISYNCRKKRASRCPSSVFKLADSIVTSSNFVKKDIKKHINHLKNTPKVNVVYPVRPVKEIRSSERRGKYITLMSPSEAKGAFVAMAVAGAMPQCSFLFTGEASLEDKRNVYVAKMLKKFRNITTIGYKKDVCEIYKKTKILLAPSLLKEAFGRVVWEAMANGIPVVGSNNGNLPNLIQKGGYVCDPRNITSWCSCIKKLMDNKQEYIMRSKKAKKEAKKYNYNEQMRKFYKIVQQLTSHN